MKLKADDVEYAFPGSMEMGELRLLKRYFDMPRPADMDLGNIDHLAGIAFIAMRRANSQIPIEVTISKVDALKRLEFVLEPGDDGYEDPDAEAAPDPTPAASGGDVDPSPPESSN